MNQYNKLELANKSNLITINDKGAKTASALFIFKTGSRNESKKNNGISHFLEHMFFKGSNKYPNTLKLSSAFDALGCEFNAFTSKEYTGYYVKTTPKKIGKALEILEDMILSPKISPKEIERERGVIIEELNMYRDNPLMHIDDVLENCLYGDTSAGWDIIGTKENIKSFKRADFTSYLKSQYGAESTNLILAGNLEEKLIKQGEKVLAKMKSGNFKEQEELVESQTKPQLNAVFKDTDQMVLALAVRSFPANDESEVAAKMLALILGGAMSSRLFIKLRERKGLAYSIRTSTEFYSNSGYLSTQAGVPIGKTEEAIEIILSEYKRLKNNLVSPEELVRAKDIMEGRVIMHLEASDELANWYGRQAVLRPKIMTPADFLTSVRKITAKDLQETAKKIFVNENLNLALIGKVKNKDFKSILKF